MDIGDAWIGVRVGSRKVVFGLVEVAEKRILRVFLLDITVSIVNNSELMAKNGVNTGFLKKQFFTSVSGKN